MKLRRFLLRYYPPGIILEYEQGGEMRNKPVDLLQLTPESDLEVIVNQIVRQEALISENRKPQLRKLLCPPELRRAPRGARALRTGDTRRPSAYCTLMRRRAAWSTGAPTYCTYRARVRVRAFGRTVRTYGGTQVLLTPTVNPHLALALPVGSQVQAGREDRVAREPELLPLQDLESAHPTADQLRVQQVGRPLHHGQLRPHLQGSSW